MEIAVVGATAVLAIRGGTVPTPASRSPRWRRRSAASPTPRRRCSEATVAPTPLQAAAQAVAAASQPISDVRASADYRDAMAAVIGRRAIEVAARARQRRARPDAREPRPARRSEVKVAATLRVNGIDYPVEIEPHLSLLRDRPRDVGLTGAKEGCDDSECGACMMLLDGEPVNSCSYLALQAEGREITTVEGLAPPGELSEAAAGVPRAWRSAVRLLHAGDADLGDGAAAPARPLRAKTRCGSRWPATCAAAPATRGSSTRCSKPPRTATDRADGGAQA